MSKVINFDTVRKLKLAFCANVLLVLLETIGLAWCIFRDGHLKLDYYTQDSNILSLFASLFLTVYIWRKLKKPAAKVPKWTSLLKYASIINLTITFLVVVFILIPIEAQEFGWDKSAYYFLLSTSMLYTHTLCPIIAITSFLVLEEHHLGDQKTIFIGLIPTATYALVAIAMNLLKIWNGPYPFLRVYEQPWWMTVIWAFIILGGSIAIAKIYEILCRKKPRC